MEDFLKSATRQFDYYKLLGEKTLTQLKDEDLHWQYNDDSNSIAMIIKHLSGNMLSRWTDFLNSDGEKTWRDRDAEFESRIETREELLNIWNKGWTCLMDALNSINEDNWYKIIYIRNEPHSVIDAINRQLAHYPYHVGQIVFIGKMLTNNNWASISIPRGKTQEFNAKKFAEESDKEKEI
jgi:hypothetical protein